MTLVMRVSSSPMHAPAKEEYPLRLGRKFLPLT